MSDEVKNLLWTRVKMGRVTGKIGQGFRYDLECHAPVWPTEMWPANVSVSVEAAKQAPDGIKRDPVAARTNELCHRIFMQLKR